MDDNSGNLGESKTNLQVGVLRAALAALEMLHLSGPLTDQAKKTLDELKDMHENLKRRERSPNDALSSQLDMVQNDGAVLRDMFADLDVALNSEDIESDTVDGDETARECVVMIQEYCQRMYNNIHLEDLSEVSPNNGKLLTARQIMHVLKGVERQYSDLLGNVLKAVSTWRLENEDVGQLALMKLRNMNPKPLAPDNPKGVNSGSAMADYANLVQELGTNKFESISSGQPGINPLAMFGGMSGGGTSGKAEEVNKLLGSTLDGTRYEGVRKPMIDIDELRRVGLEQDWIASQGYTFKRHEQLPFDVKNSRFVNLDSRTQAIYLMLHPEQLQQYNPNKAKEYHLMLDKYKEAARKFRENAKIANKTLNDGGHSKIAAMFCHVPTDYDQTDEDEQRTSLLANLACQHQDTLNKVNELEAHIKESTLKANARKSRDVPEEKKQAYAKLVLKTVMEGLGVPNDEAALGQIMETVGHVDLPTFDDTQDP